MHLTSFKDHNRILLHLRDCLDCRHFKDTAWASYCSTPRLSLSIWDRYGGKKASTKVKEIEIMGTGETFLWAEAEKLILDTGFVLF